MKLGFTTFTSISPCRRTRRPRRRRHAEKEHHGHGHGGAKKSKSPKGHGHSHGESEHGHGHGHGHGAVDVEQGKKPAKKEATQLENLALATLRHRVFSPEGDRVARRNEWVWREGQIEQ
jgi:ABC-type nickel/cobalt efflux system permease component RcnA